MPDSPTTAPETTLQDVLDFWFDEATPEQWFERDDAFDALIRERFADAIEAARAGALNEWCETPRGCLALILLIDQFSRNLYRGSPLAWTEDGRALSLTKLAIERGYDTALPLEGRKFLYMPLMHSEVIADQELSVNVFCGLAEEGAEGGENTLDFAVRHRDIIARFARFPHRNDTLGRRSTAEEIAFLKEPDSSF